MMRLRLFYIIHSLVLVYAMAEFLDTDTSEGQMHPVVRRLLVEEQEVAVQEGAAWHAARRMKITGSVAASVLGINPFCTRKELMNKKLGVGPEFKGNFMTAYGTRMEDVCADRYAETTGKTLHAYGFKTHPQISFLGASPDRFTSDGIMVEIKCPV